MAGQGVFAVDRGIFDHPIFAPEPFTEREAWLWMLSSAAWADKRVRVGKTMIDLQRGQLAFATRFLAVKWQWSHSKVVRFLNRLKTDTMLTAQPTHDATLITICNYSEYQFGRNATETQIETQSGTQPERNRNKEEELKKDNNKEERKKETREAALVSDFEFEDFWKLWPNKVGKPAALKAFVSARKRAGLDAIVEGVFAYIRDKPPDRPWLNPATFLNQNRWEDQPATVSVSNGKPKSALIQAANNLIQRIAIFDGPPADRVRGDEGEDPPRLLSHG